MSEQYGILLVSHVAELADGLARLLKQAAKDVNVKAVGGTEDGGIGTDFDKIMGALGKMKEPEILAFYDLGSAKMNLELVRDLTDKKLIICDVAFVEGAYTAAALVQADTPFDDLCEQLQGLKVK
ncbi:dihydroxyacetone kinase DhaM subunit [Trichococcus patagoniensis]|uniref:phosphoenolpyruvate--glycerone phosphotransferase n=1 Tax=Trichococcus patagoniensis TaxID=382641 RepID=A0A2T5ICR4_9LACT|nr:dihydroxyacetone kinase phosphoryl donor subunit DhaM [Trichococcus patagoniensis]PTQ81616.1 dihydroxyacetone kinase DhaM subunit [Trichococcus patagoniensis]